MTSTLTALLPLLTLWAASDEPYRTWAPVPAEARSLPETAGHRLSAAELDQLRAGKPVLPFNDITTAVKTQDGAIWAGSTHGLMLLAPGGERWRVFHSRRWLPSDEVRNLAVTSAGDVFVETNAGIAKLAARETTLSAKMAHIDAMLQKHHLREGMVTAISLKQAGDLSTARVQGSNDNDGLWTSIYIAAQAFRYGATHDEEAKRNARRSLEALMFLERVSGIPGFVARSVVPSKDDPTKYRGEWHRSADKRWWWKGDTSSDEVVGHYFAYQIYYDVAADERERAEIRPYVERITDHILDHGLYYVGPPGVPTTWGIWAPEKLNHDLRRFGDRGLNSLEILSHLKVAEHIVGKPRYTQKIKELIEQHSYHINTVGQKQTWPENRVNHSDDELAFLSYYPLLVLERDPELRKVYLASIRRSWLIEQPEHSSLFNLIYGAALQASDWPDPSKRPTGALVAPDEYDRDECLAWFRDVPEDTITWTVTNGDRQDVTISGMNRFRRPQGRPVLPPSERHVMRWNGDPYVLDGGSEGRSRDDGGAILLPYWMGIWHRLID
ncbi:MAG TPA: hypothetical protein VL175_01715 [Pirellulales bacterium]|jgi:hypothetical protein|nr:hypothetical protein [Pirellulales bacterium]